MHQRNSKQLGLSNLCKSVFICGSFLLVLPAGGAAVAQRGGKAEPNRIAFKRGATSTTINDVVRGDEEAEYLLAAKKGQRLIIKLTSVPTRSSSFELLAPDNDPPGFDQHAIYNYSVTLPKTGDYFINVSQPTEAQGKSRYKLTITIR